MFADKFPGLAKDLKAANDAKILRRNSLNINNANRGKTRSATEEEKRLEPPAGPDLATPSPNGGEGKLVYTPDGEVRRELTFADDRLVPVDSSEMGGGALSSMLKEKEEAAGEKKNDQKSDVGPVVPGASFTRTLVEAAQDAAIDHLISPIDKQMPFPGQGVISKMAKVGVRAGNDLLEKMIQGQMEAMQSAFGASSYPVVPESKHDVIPSARGAVVGENPGFNKPGGSSSSMTKTDTKTDIPENKYGTGPQDGEDDEDEDVDEDEDPRRNPEFPYGGQNMAQLDGIHSAALRNWDRKYGGFPPGPKTTRVAHEETVVGQNKEGGDEFMNNPNRDEAEATLRPQFGIAGAEDVIPPPKEQLRSDLEFDLFSVVPPGYGEGVSNKQFLYQRAWEDYIRFAPPFFEPAPWLGPLNTAYPLPWQWQNVKAPADVNRYYSKVASKEAAANKVFNAHGEGSAAAFGRDVPETPMSISSSGLPRDRRSPLEPVIQNSLAWTPEFDPAGYLLNQRGFKRTYSAWRDPDAREVQRDNGGPTLRKRRALEVILP
jgi:hypothetical protein